MYQINQAYDTLSNEHARTIYHLQFEILFSSRRRTSSSRSSTPTLQYRGPRNAAPRKSQRNCNARGFKIEEICAERTRDGGNDCKEMYTEK